MEKYQKKINLNKLKMINLKKSFQGIKLLATYLSKFNKLYEHN